jgi:hypothetical protein
VARMGEKRNVYRLLVGKPEGKRPLGRPRRRWLDNIKMDPSSGYTTRGLSSSAQLHGQSVSGFTTLPDAILPALHSAPDSHKRSLEFSCGSHFCLRLMTHKNLIS